MRRGILAFGALALLLPSRGLAQDTPIRHGTSDAAQPGVLNTLAATPSVAGAWHLVTRGQYGYEPDVLVEEGSRQRAAGRLALGYSPWEFFQVALSLDASVDSYQWPGDDADSLVVGALGDPRLSLRTGWHLGAGVSLGALFDLWFPSGRGAFNVVGGAISPSVFAMASFAPESIPIGLHLNVGYRHDRSIEMLGDISQLTREQLLLSGGTSAANHLVLRLAVEYRLGPVAPFVETDVDLPLDEGGMERSPVMLGVGLRAWLGPRDEVQLFLAGEFRVTGAPPAPDPTAGTIWEHPPLVNILVGASFRLPVAPTERTVTVGGEEGPIEGPEPPPEPGRIAGRVRCGEVSCGRGTTISIAGTGGSPYAADEGTGEFTTSELPPGTYTVEASAPGRLPRSQEVAVEAGGTARADLDLPASETAERPGIRGRVTDFEGQPVAATIRIPALDLELTCDEGGGFETDVDPGQYEVIISASDFATQTTRIEVTQAGVVVMNVELRRRR